MAELESTILNGLTFSIFESVAAPKKKEIAEQIKKYGGAVSYMISNNVTHLVVRDDDLKKTDNPKIKKAKDKKITLITEVALTKLIEAKRKDATRSQPSSGLATPNKQGPRTPSKELATTNGRDTPARAPSSPTKVKQSDSLVKASELNISVVSQSNLHKGPPTVTLLLPDHGAITGDFQVAVFGLGFTPNPKFRVKFGSVTSVSYEFHSGSSVICRIPSTLVQAGEVLVAASNDGGRTYGFPARFKFIDAVFSTGITSPDVQMSLLSGQLLNLHRAIQNIQRMEVDLKNQLQAVAGVDIVALQKQYALDNDIEEDYNSEEHDEQTEDEEEPVEVPAAQRAKTTKKALLDREIRLFIASPFRDMQSERDLLVKMVIPKLRKMCMERDIVFSYVDLRWGVTDQQNESAATMLMCLREIERCNMFICSYGERYGWSISPEHEGAANELLTRHFETAAKEFPWVDKFKDRSVTELELRMVLEKRFNGPEKSAWFYLRDPYFIEEVPDKDKHLFLPEGQISSKKLAKLKQFIQESDHPVKNYNRPTQMTELVFEDLKNCIEQKYPKDTTLSSLERERFRHEIYSRSLLRVYLPHEDSLMSVDKYIAGSSRSPYVISGPSGIGKSALLANWVTRHREHFPEDIVISHFIGASPNSATHTSMLYRIMAELHEILDLDETLPDPDTQGQTVVREFFKWLENTMIDKNPNKRRLIIVIDGINKLDDRENARELIWFPQCFPKRVRVVVTTTPGTSMDVLKKRKCEVLEVPALSEGDRKSFLRVFLNLSSKKLTEGQELKIAAAPQSAHPRFLQTLLEDICVFGAHEELEKRISHDLRAKNAAELYEIVLDRMEVDFDLRNKGVVNLFLSYIACSRRGLYLEQELKPLLAQKKINEEDWTDFFVTAEEQLLSSTGGLLSFVNEDIQKAVERKYLSDKDTTRQLHEELATFFHKIEDLSQRKVDELPWQLEKAAMWDMLKTTLSNLAMFDKLWIPANKFDLLRYWRSIEKNSQFEAYQCYKTVIDLSQFPPGMIVGDLMFELGQCLLEMAKYNGAEEVYYKAIDYFQKASQRLNVAKVYVDLATLFTTRSNESEKSEKMLLQAQEVYEKEKGGDAAEVGVVLNKLGVVYTNTNQPKRALEVLARALRICESTLGVDHLQTGEVYYSLGCAHLSLRDLPEAERCLLRALKITEEQLGDGDPDVSNILNRIGTLYIEMDQFNDAEAAFKRALLIREKKLGEDHSRVAQTLKHMISLYEMQENYDDAILVGRRALNISKKIFGDSSLQVANVYMRLGVIFMVDERFDEAREVLRSALVLKEKLSGKGSKAVEEVQHILDEIDKPKHVPPPPPPPGARLPPPPQQVKNVPPTMPVSKVIDIPLGPGGVPPPPPPPPPGPKAVQVQVQVQEQSYNGGYLADLQNYSRSALKRAEVVDKSDGKQAAIAMLAQKKSKLKLKKATWTNEDDDAEMEVPKTRKPVLLQNLKKK